MCPFFEKDLPQSTDNQDLEEDTLKALNAILPTDRITFHSGPKSDAGIDGTLEAKQDGNRLGAFAHVQLKGMGKDSPNEDGTRSRSGVTTANLRYLLNTGLGLYILYVKATGALWYAWASEVYDALEEQRPDWGKQAEFTVRFSRPLDAEAINAIRQEMIARSTLFANVGDAMRNSAGSLIQVRIDQNDMSVTTPDQAYTLLSEHGIAMVSDNMIEEVRNLMSLLDEQRRDDPIIRLTAGYSSYLRGEFLEARVELGRVMLAISVLTNESAMFARYLLDGCDFQIGRLTAQQYGERLRCAADESGPILGRYLRHVYLRYSYLQEVDEVRRGAILQDLRSNYDAFIKLDDVPRSAVFEMYNSLLFVEGTHAAYGFSDAFMLTFMTAGPTALNRAPIVIKDVFGTILEQLDWAVEQAQTAGFVRTTADLLCTRAVVRSFPISYLALLQRVGFLPTAELPGYAHAKSDLEVAIATFLQIRYSEGRLRATILLARLFEIAGDNEGAKMLGASVQSEATAAGLTNIEQISELFAEGNTGFSKAIDEITLLSNDQLARLTDADADHMAELDRRARGLPESTLAIMSTEWRQRVAEAKAQLDLKS